MKTLFFGRRRRRGVAADRVDPVTEGVSLQGSTLDDDLDEFENLGSGRTSPVAVTEHRVKEEERRAVEEAPRKWPDLVPFQEETVSLESAREMNPKCAAAEWQACDFDVDDRHKCGMLSVRIRGYSKLRRCPRHIPSDAELPAWRDK